MTEAAEPARDDAELTRRAKELACRDVVDLVTDYLEDALDADSRGVVEAHLSLCGGCAEYLAQMRATIAAVGHVPVDSLSERAKADLVAAFRGLRSTGT